MPPIGHPGRPLPQPKEGETRPPLRIHGPDQDVLTALAKRINDAHEAGEKLSHAGVKHFWRAGEALIESKEKVGHGNWLKFLEENCPAISERRAQRYMALAESDVTSDLEARWRILCGNSSARKPRKPRPTDPDVPDDASSGPLPKTHALSVPADKYANFARRLKRAGEALGTGANDFETVYELLKPYDEEEARG